MYRLRPFTEADYEPYVAIRNLLSPEPVTANQLRERDSIDHSHPTNTLIRLVVVDATGTLVGGGFVEHLHHMPEGRWGLHVLVHPERQGQGVGALLLTEFERIAQEGGCTELDSHCRGEDDRSYAWAQRHGYMMDRQRTESVLDLTGWDPSRFAAAVEHVQASGIRIETLTALPEDGPLLHNLWDLDTVTSYDVPAFDNWQLPDYETWVKEFRADSTPTLITIARDGERVVGVTFLHLPTAEGAGAGIGYTAVYREYRGRGIAMALKVVSMNEAAVRGIAHVRTNNDPDNPPMLAVNGKLGFVLVPGPRRLKKQV